jgi:hypothetical protein
VSEEVERLHIIANNSETLRAENGRAKLLGHFTRNVIKI